MPQVVTAVLTVIMAMIVAGALVYIGGFVLSMIAAMFVVPIEGIIHLRHHPLAH